MKNEKLPESPADDFSVKKVKSNVANEKGISSRKLLVNPYQGCSHRCLFCPANDGFLKKYAFDDFREKGVIRVVENIIDHIDAYLEKHPEVKVAHLSPAADPFQPIESECGLSHRIMEHCTEIELPIALCSKGIIPESAMDMLLRHPNSFAQLSILSPTEKKRRFLVRGEAPSVDKLLETLEKMTSKGILVVGRIDPIFPYITDDMEEFSVLVKALKERGVEHIVSSVADIIDGALEREADYLDTYEKGLVDKYRELYVERINGRNHAHTGYRRKIFASMLDICREQEMGFGITWEPAVDGTSLAPEFSINPPEHLRKILS